MPFNAPLLTYNIPQAGNPRSYVMLMESMVLRCFGSALGRALRFAAALLVLAAVVYAAHDPRPAAAAQPDATAAHHHAGHMQEDGDAPRQCHHVDDHCPAAAGSAAHRSLESNPHAPDAAAHPSARGPVWRLARDTAPPDNLRPPALPRYLEISRLRI
jgi:hypothetical protein